MRCISSKTVSKRTVLGLPDRFDSAVRGAMLDIRPSCECCDADLPPESPLVMFSLTVSRPDEVMATLPLAAVVFAVTPARPSTVAICTAPLPLKVKPPVPSSHPSSPRQSSISLMGLVPSKMLKIGT